MALKDSGQKIYSIFHLWVNGPSTTVDKWIHYHVQHLRHTDWLYIEYANSTCLNQRVQEPRHPTDTYFQYPFFGFLYCPLRKLAVVPFILMVVWHDQKNSKVAFNYTLTRVHQNLVFPRYKSSQVSVKDWQRCRFMFKCTILIATS